jgi:hypothetical protein
MREEKSDWTRGDVIVVEGRHVGGPSRKGEILEVLGEASHPHFSVRWEDGSETIFYPAQDLALRHADTHE